MDTCSGSGVALIDLLKGTVASNPFSAATASVAVEPTVSPLEDPALHDSSENELKKGRIPVGNFERTLQPLPPSRDRKIATMSRDRTRITSSKQRMKITEIVKRL
jgi:hypothetical protein